MLARMYGIAAATPRVSTSVTSSSRTSSTTRQPLWRHGYRARQPQRQACLLGVRHCSRMLDGAAFTGTGPQMIPGNNPHQPDTSDWVGFDYRFNRDGMPCTCCGGATTRHRKLPG